MYDTIAVNVMSQLMCALNVHFDSRYSASQSKKSAPLSSSEWGDSVLFNAMLHVYFISTTCWTSLNRSPVARAKYTPLAHPGCARITKRCVTCAANGP